MHPEGQRLAEELRATRRTHVEGIEREFLAHLTEQIRVETMLRNVHRDASSTMRTVLSDWDPVDDDSPALLPAQPPLGTVTLLAQEDGFLTWIDERAVLERYRRIGGSFRVAFG